MTNKHVNESLIPFSLPSHGEAEIEYILEALAGHHRHGSGTFTQRASLLLKQITKANKVLLTHSCTGALEFAMLLSEIGQGDEVILPSFTFSSTANAVALRGAIPVFADIDPRTQCLDPVSVLEAISPATKAILPVHYAGVSCDMNALSIIANQNQLLIIEDAAQTIGSYIEGNHLGSIGTFGTLSFHDSKNISCGEGGALLINDEAYIERAEILWEKGTNRTQFMRGEVDKYTWVDIGSSFLPSEISAAFLLGQLERFETVNKMRLQRWVRYHECFADLEKAGMLNRPSVPSNCHHNAHIYYLILNTPDDRDALLCYLKMNGVSATFHYVPLHNSPAGKRYGISRSSLPNSEKAGACLIRLPLFPEMTSCQQDRVISFVNEFFISSQSSRSLKAG